MNADDYVERGKKYLAEKQFDLARADYAKAIDLNSAHGYLLVDIAWCDYMLDEFESCIKHCDEMLGLNPDGPHLSGACMYKGWALDRLGKDQEALQTYNRGLEGYAADSSLRWARGILLERLGRFGEAMNDYEESIDTAISASEKDDYIRQIESYKSSLLKKITAQ